MRLTGRDVWPSECGDMSDMVTSSSDALYGVFSTPGAWDAHHARSDLSGNHPQQSQQHAGYGASPPQVPAPPPAGGDRPRSGGRRSSSGGSRSSGGGGGKSTYKHVPHRDKPPHLVARRNARERRRVQAVNSAFARLRKCVPSENRSKRLSKVKTLQRAIEYIHGLQDLLSEADCVATGGGVTALHETSVAAAAAVQAALEGLDDFSVDQVSAVNKENEIGHRWITLETSCSQENYSSFIPFYEDFPGSVH